MSKIIQGNVGNCYFVAAVVLVAQKPEQIKRLFLNSNQFQETTTSQENYTLRFFKFGKWHEIVVNSQIPTKSANSNHLIFARFIIMF